MTKSTKAKWRVVADPSIKYELGSYNVRFHDQSIILPLSLWQKIHKDLKHRTHKPEDVLRHLLNRPLSCGADDWNLLVTVIAVKQLAEQVRETPFAYLVTEIVKTD